jgi:hypothetical protein
VALWGFVRIGCPEARCRGRAAASMAGAREQPVGRALCTWAGPAVLPVRWISNACMECMALAAWVSTGLVCIETPVADLVGLVHRRMRPAVARPPALVIGPRCVSMLAGSRQRRGRRSCHATAVPPAALGSSTEALPSTEWAGCGSPWHGMGVREGEMCSERDVQHARVTWNRAVI